MKLRTQLIMLVAILCMASCEKNDEPEINLAQDIAGVYNGQLTLSVGSTAMDPVENSKVTIKHQENGKAEVTLAGFGEGAMSFQDIVIKDVVVTKGGNDTYSLVGDIDAMSGTTNVTGKVEGTVIKGGKANITFTLKPGAMPMSINAVFNGQ